MQRARIAVLALAAAVAAGCSERGGDAPAASAGRKIDQASAEVKRKAGDAAITARVRAALLGASGLSAARVEVHTADGVVTLSGSVDSPQAGVRAQEIVQRIDGVRAVENRLTVGATG